jgi:hypothetical protein
MRATLLRNAIRVGLLAGVWLAGPTPWLGAEAPAETQPAPTPAAPARVPPALDLGGSGRSVHIGVVPPQA